MKDVTFNAYTKELMDQITKGAFLTVSDQDKTNVMTIGWGSVGVIWRVPVFTVMVRYSRYTYDMINNSQQFAVSVPLHDQFTSELALCGSKSAREMDKFKEAKLATRKAKIVSAPIIEGCDLFYECQVVYRQAMEPGLLLPEINKQFYSGGNYHVLYYGRIVASYIKE